MKSASFIRGANDRVGKLGCCWHGALANFAAAIAVVGALSAGVSNAQQPAKQLQFEVATIRASNPKLGLASSSSGGGPGGQLRMVNTPLRRWVEIGLSVSDYALRAPSWLETSRFDLEARMPSAPINQKAGAEMMRALLVERFGLKWHEETGMVSGYQLVADKKVLAQPASLLERLRGLQGSSSGPTMIQGRNMPMSEFADMLAKAVGRPVVDPTNLSGGFDIQLRWRPLDDAAVAEQKKYDKQAGFDVDTLPDSLFTAIHEQLGLRLQSARVPSRVIVVDHIDSRPTEN